LLRRVELRGRDGQLTDTIGMGDPLSIAIDVDGLEIPKQYMVVTITTETDAKAIYFNTMMKPPESFDDDATQDRLVFTFPNLPLTPGRYFLDVVLTEGGMAVKSTLDRV